MKRAVLISIRPEWVEKIASGQKTLEVRKIIPKLETPFKCYIYQTKNGGVVGEFVCDYIFAITAEHEVHDELPGSPVETWLEWNDAPEKYQEEADIEKDTCLTIGDIKCYMWNTPCCFCWHISNMKLYETPKKLDEFRVECKGGCDIPYLYELPCEICRKDRLTRPPQSWCYVEKIEAEGSV